MKKGLLAISFCLLCLPTAARADVSLLVLEAMGVAGEYTGSGHTAVYLSNVCLETPERVRLCGPEERGIVISSYPALVLGKDYEWFATPLIPFLYGVEEERDVPVYANAEIRRFLRENYRRNNLSHVVPGNEDGTMPEGRWSSMLGVAMTRDVYRFNVTTTQAEDEQFVRDFNNMPRGKPFNSFTNNCADYSKKIINRYFAGAAKRDWINDIGITTPKAVARSFTRYSKKRPERLFHITRHTQLAGPIWRASDNRNFSEHAFKSKKYFIPSLIFDPPLLAWFAGAYYLTGRFSIHSAYREVPSPLAAQLRLDMHRSKTGDMANAAAVESLDSLRRKIKSERLRILGGGEFWAAKRGAFSPILQRALNAGLFRDLGEVRSFFRDLEGQSEPTTDADGRLMLKVRSYGQARELGLTRDNIMAPFSDRELALKLMIAKVASELGMEEKDRSTAPEFQETWDLLQELLKDESAIYAGIDKARGRFLQTPVQVPMKKKFEKLLVKITH
jgi:hypothetical protein